MSVKLANSQHNQQIREVSQQPTANRSVKLANSQHNQQIREVGQQPTEVYNSHISPPKRDLTPNLT